MSTRDAMAIGTAGYTAMLAVMALERHGLDPQRGPAVVTGAAGGVGSVAVAMLAKLGWHVIASTGRPQEADYLKAWAPREIIERQELAAPPKPLAKERWAAGVDSVGSTTLANVLSMTRARRCHRGLRPCRRHGFADKRRAVHSARRVAVGNQLGDVPARAAQEAWQRLERDLDREKLAAMTSEIGLADVVEAGRQIVAGQIRGRVVVRIA